MRFVSIFLSFVKRNGFAFVFQNGIDALKKMT